MRHRKDVSMCTLSLDEDCLTPSSKVDYTIETVSATVV